MANVLHYLVYKFWYALSWDYAKRWLKIFSKSQFILKKICFFVNRLFLFGRIRSNFLILLLGWQRLIRQRNRNIFCYHFGKLIYTLFFFVITAIASYFDYQTKPFYFNETLIFHNLLNQAINNFYQRLLMLLLCFLSNLPFLQAILPIIIQHILKLIL